MKKYPIAERFTSPQGEGLWAGTLMHFIRFAGCSVGKKISETDPNFEKKQLPVYVEKCTTYDGREFLCDTDFRTKEALTVSDLLDGIPKGVKHICLTGGEPLVQPLEDFIDYIGSETSYMVHIETSGTIDFKKVYPAYHECDSKVDSDHEGWLWITVSPKLAVLPEMLKMANEIKLLVDDGFDVNKVPKEVFDHELVWLSPINDEHSLVKKNQDRCLELLYKYPNWRLACQMHKIWGVR